MDCGGNPPSNSERRVDPAVAGASRLQQLCAPGINDCREGRRPPGKSCPEPAADDGSGLRANGGTGGLECHGNQRW